MSTQKILSYTGIHEGISCLNTVIRLVGSRPHQLNWLVRSPDATGGERCPSSCAHGGDRSKGPHAYLNVLDRAALAHISQRQSIQCN